MYYRFGDFTLDVEHRNLICRDSAIACDDRMITLLNVLIQAYPAHCEQHILLQKIWPNTVVSHWSIARLISDTRKLFKAHGLNTQLIQTLHGRGYRLSHEVPVSYNGSTPNKVRLDRQRRFILMQTKQ